jgi:hypothetical protein
MVFLLGFVVIFIAGYMVWNNEDGKQREVKIVAEYQVIKHPEGAKLVYYELNRKIINRWIRSEYMYSISNEEVKKFYEQEFVSKGWRQIPYNSRPEDVFYKYVKDNLSLVLGLHKDNSWTLSMHYDDAKY